MFKTSFAAATASLVVITALETVQSAHAQLVANDGFSYTSGSSFAGGSGGTGWAGTWTTGGTSALGTNTASSLSYTDGGGNMLQTSGGGASVIGINTTTVNPGRVLSSTFGTMAANNTAATGTLWMSFLWQGLNTSTAGSLFRQASLGFYSGSTVTASPNGQEKLDFGMPNIQVATGVPNFSVWGANFVAGASITPGATIGSATPAISLPLQASVAANAGNTTFVTMEMIIDATTGADTLYLWLNPNLSSAPSIGSADLTITGIQDLTSINSIRLTGNNINAADGPLSGQQLVDEIRIGDTYADIAPFTVGSVPEPSPMALCAIGGFLLMPLLRRRK